MLTLFVEGAVELAHQLEELALLLPGEDGEPFVDQGFVSRDDPGECAPSLVRWKEAVGSSLRTTFDQAALLHTV